MTTTLLLMVGALMVLCVLLMRWVLRLEFLIFDLNEQIDRADQEYIDLFEENLKLSDKIGDIKVIKILKKVNDEK